MKSERRDTPRIPITLDAIVHYNNRTYRHATRDISLDGAFVRMDGRRPPRRGAMELAIRLPDEGQFRYHRFRAQVVRATRHGWGLVFDRTDTDAYAALLDLVFSRREGAQG